MADLEKNDNFQDRGVLKLTDGTYTLDLVGEGLELKDRNLDGTPGTLQGIVVFANGNNGKAAYLSVCGKDNNELRTVERHSVELQDIVEQLKINNAYLSILTGEHLTVNEIGEDLT